MNQNMKGVLALVVLIGFLLVLCGLLFFPIPEGSKSLINVMFGAVGGGFTMVLSYYFGSSAPGPRNRRATDTFVEPGPSSTASATDEDFEKVRGNRRLSPAKDNPTEPVAQDSQRG